MDFQLGQDQLAIRSMVREFARKEIAPKALEWDEADLSSFYYFDAEIMLRRTQKTIKNAAIATINRPRNDSCWV